MAYHARGAVLPALFSLVIAGCGGPNLKDSAGERLSLAHYDHVALQPVEVASRQAPPGVSEELAAHIRTQLNESKSWAETPEEPVPTDAVNDGNSLGQIDLAVTILKARYPSRSKTIWLGSAHKMTCCLTVHNHATGTLLGSVKISSSVEPLMGSAALLNCGTVGIVGRACVDTRKHDANSLLTHMAKQIVTVLDRARGWDGRDASAAHDSGSPLTP